MGKQQYFFDLDNIKNMYFKEQLSLRETANLLGTSSATVGRFLIKNKIARRSLSSAMHIAQEKRDFAIEIDLTPTKDVGYICGVIIGDASIIKTSSKNYRIDLETTRQDFVMLFYESIKSTFPDLSPYMHKRVKTRCFPNGQTYINDCWCVSFNSKRLYNALRPFKMADYKWLVPTFLATQESLVGFLQGLFDAEGSVANRNIALYSKHLENLLPIQKLLANFGIESCLHNKYRMSTLRINKAQSLAIFTRKIGFRYLRKSLKCQKWLAD